MKIACRLIDQLDYAENSLVYFGEEIHLYAQNSVE